MKSGIISFVFLSMLALLSCSYFPEDFDRRDISDYEENAKYIKIGSEGTKALIFYPGGLVDPAAYVKLLTDIDVDSLMVFILKAPYHLAILDINQAEEIRTAFPEIVEWSLMGHSLGGSVACFVVEDHPDEYKNLILLASYPADQSDLKSFSGIAVSMAGTEDGVLDFEKYESSQSKFLQPEMIHFTDQLVFEEGRSYFLEIEGGNHSNFGNYGLQKGDGVSNITKESQQGIVRQILRNIL